MKTKVCTKCKIEKDVGDFHFSCKISGELHFRCKKCRNKSNRRYSKKAKAVKKRRESRKELIKSKRPWYINLKENKPCFDCGNKYPSYVMQFDHVPGRGEKKGPVSKMWRVNSKDVVLEEISKCDLVCANCHSIRTYKRIKG